MPQSTLRIDLPSPATGLGRTNITSGDGDQLVREALIRPRHLDRDVKPVDHHQHGTSTTLPRRPFPRVRS